MQGLPKESAPRRKDDATEKRLIYSEGPRMYKGAHTGGQNGNPNSRVRNDQ